MKTATSHKEESLKLYIVQYNRGEDIVEIRHYVGSNEMDIRSQIKEDMKGKSPLFRPYIHSIKEVTHPDYHINLERKVK